MIGKTFGIFQQVSKLLSRSNAESKTEDKLLGNFVIPLDGKMLSLSKVPDEVFSQKIMGDGFAIEPDNGEVVSPVDGIVSTILDSKHAVGIKAHNGLELIVHFGIDTVELKGEGFTALVRAGDQIKAGQALLSVDIDFVKGKAASVITPIVFTNLSGQTVLIDEGKVVKRGQKHAVALA